MESTLAGIIRNNNLPLGEIIEDNPGFRICSNSDLLFTLKSTDENQLIHICQEQSLKVESRINIIGANVVISHNLENEGKQISIPINVIEPLYLVFRLPSENWRHIYANGGTSERYYPPLAYRTNERYRSKAPLVIESHPKGRSSNLHLPFLISLSSVEKDSKGIYCGMEWSAGWYIKFDSMDEDRSYLAVGLKVNGVQLKPGEKLELPSVHIGFFKGGTNAGTNLLRRYLHKRFELNR